MEISGISIDPQNKSKVEKKNERGEPIELVKKHLTSFSEVFIQSNTPSINLSYNKITSFEGFPSSTDKIHEMILDSNPISSFFGAHFLKNLTYLSLKSTPLSRNPYLKLMCLVAFGPQLRSVNNEAISKKTRHQADALRESLQHRLYQGEIIIHLTPLRMINPRTKKAIHPDKKLKNITTTISYYPKSTDEINYSYMQNLEFNENAQIHPSIAVLCNALQKNPNKISVISLKTKNAIQRHLNQLRTALGEISEYEYEYDEEEDILELTEQKITKGPSPDANFSQISSKSQISVSSLSKQNVPNQKIENSNLQKSLINSSSSKKNNYLESTPSKRAPCSNKSTSPNHEKSSTHDSLKDSSVQDEQFSHYSGSSIKGQRKITTLTINTTNHDLQKQSNSNESFGNQSEEKEALLFPEEEFNEEDSLETKMSLYHIKHARLSAYLYQQPKILDPVTKQPTTPNNNIKSPFSIPKTNYVQQVPIETSNDQKSTDHHDDNIEDFESFSLPEDIEEQNTKQEIKEENHKNSDDQLIDVLKKFTKTPLEVSNKQDGVKTSTELDENEYQNNSFQIEEEEDSFQFQIEESDSVHDEHPISKEEIKENEEDEPSFIFSDLSEDLQ